MLDINKHQNETIKEPGIISKALKGIVKWLNHENYDSFKNYVKLLFWTGAIGIISIPGYHLMDSIFTWRYNCKNITERIRKDHPLKVVHEGREYVISSSGSTIDGDLWYVFTKRGATVSLHEMQPMSLSIGRNKFDMLIGAISFPEEEIKDQYSDLIDFAQGIRKTAYDTLEAQDRRMKKEKEAELEGKKRELDEKMKSRRVKDILNGKDDSTLTPDKEIKDTLNAKDTLNKGKDTLNAKDTPNGKDTLKSQGSLHNYKDAFNLKQDIRGRQFAQLPQFRKTIPT